MKISLIVLKLLFLGALFIVSNHELYLKDADDRGTFMNMYSSWLSVLFEQGIEVTSYVVKFEWLPINESQRNRELDKT